MLVCIHNNIILLPFAVIDDNTVSENVSDSSIVNVFHFPPNTIAAFTKTAT